MKDGKIGKIIARSLRAQGIPKVRLAEHLGISRQALHYKMKNNSWTNDELETVAGLLAIQFRLVTIGQENKKRGGSYDWNV